MRIEYKQLTANQAWKGKRFKSDKYKTYERDMLYLLPKFAMPEAPYSLTITFGVSNIGQDIDNGLKVFIDVLQKKYGFNDNKVMQLHVYKTKTEKGNEFIDFEIIEVK